MKQIVFTFILTTIFWWGVDKIVSGMKSMPEENPTEIVSTDQDPTLPDASPAQDQAATVETSQAPAINPKYELVGKWTPVEGVKHPLEFTKYGVMIRHWFGIRTRYEYAADGDKLRIQYDNATFKIFKEDGDIYLEIYNSTDYSGRYQLVTRPKIINATMLPSNEYPTLIIGKWRPINGQEHPIEFTQFGTVIQYWHGIESREDYSLNKDRLSIKYGEKARVVISEDAEYYYLEIYNTTDFSGRYKKSK